MKNIYYFLFLLCGTLLMTSCLKDDNEYETYEAWKLENEAYFDRMKDTLDADTEKPYYQELASESYPEYKVLYHVLEPGETDGRIPYYTSTVKVDYKGMLYNGTVFEDNTDKVFKVSGLIPGWQTALQQMPEGSKWRIVIPWQLAYGASGSGSSIPPYSTLVFEMTLKEITKWETGTN